jgi:hypothetical protein
MRIFTAGISQAFPQQNTTPTKFAFEPARAGANGTLIAVILDESGSMASCWAQTISGFNEFVQGQCAAEHAGKAYLTLVKFDSPLVKTVHENTLVNQVPPLTQQNYTPRGGTNLMDAIGMTIMSINNFLHGIVQEERPGVLVVIITDGEENASRKFNGSQIKSMVQQSEQQGDWTYTFLGANVDAFAMGANFGMNASNTASYDTTSMAATMDVLSKSTVNMRMAKSRGLTTQDIYASNSIYQDHDRAKMRGN